MEEYEKLLNSLIADYKRDKPSAKRDGALDALFAARTLLKAVQNKN